MDQLTSVGVTFQDEVIPVIFQRSVQYYEDPPKQPRSLSTLFSRRESEWASPAVYEKYKPVRPFGLGEIYESERGIWNLAGKSTRTPGLYKRSDPDTGISIGVPMVHTNERIHPCVRYRLELDGLGPDDIGRYQCTALTTKGHGPWRLRETRKQFRDPIPWNASWSTSTPAMERPEEIRWVWEYNGPEEEMPSERVMVEENLGPYQRQLLLLSTGKENSRSVVAAEGSAADLV